MVIGANVMSCGHDGWFVADLMFIGAVCVVHASRPVEPGNLTRGLNKCATHVISDFPIAGFWKPKFGVFVVPKEQVITLK